MNYAELQQAIIDDTHRPDKAALVPRFIRQAEGLIRTDLTAYELSTTLGEADRVSNGTYRLPARIVEIRSLYRRGVQGYALRKVSAEAVRGFHVSSDPTHFAQFADDRIEIRGTPGLDATFDLAYFGTPAPLANPTDTNELLTDYETLYISGAKFFLYTNTQDRELANDDLAIFTGMIETLNEQAARKIGGAEIAPAYNFSAPSSY